MSKYQQKFIVQELETMNSSIPIHSAILALRPTLNLPVNMKSYEDAFSSAIEEIGGEFLIFSFYTKED